MTATVTDLSKWREDHPPAVRLAQIGLHCWSAYWRLVFAAQAAAVSAMVRNR